MSNNIAQEIVNRMEAVAARHGKILSEEQKALLLQKADSAYAGTNIKWTFPEASISGKE